MLPVNIAIRRLEQVTQINCGITHESKDPKFSALTCPIRKRNNIACCHQELNTSVSFNIRDALNTLAIIQNESELTLVSTNRIEEMKLELAKVQQALLVIDRKALEYYRLHNASPQRIQQKFGSTQLRLSYKINTIRLEVLAVLQLLEEYQNPR